MRDYQEWLRSYDDPASSLSWRLTMVQTWIREELDRRRGGDVLSICAGDGRDVLGVLDGHPDAQHVRAVLLERHPTIAQRARDRAAAAQLTGVEVRSVDAGHSDNYRGAVPADLVLLVGVLGNISEPDLWRTLAASRQWCRPGAALLWSRARAQHDLNPRIRAEFDRLGFAELDYEEHEGASLPALGRLRFEEPGDEAVAGVQLFEFIR